MAIKNKNRGRYGKFRPMRSLTFRVKFDKGLADRNRLPLEHVLSVLSEVKSMIETAGKVIQREKGIEKPTGDFGLELVAGFKKGSIQANIAITRDLRTGRAAAEKILETIDCLEQMVDRSETKEPEGLDPLVVRHLNRIARVQKTDKTEMRLELRNGRLVAAARFGEAGIASAEALRAPQFEMEGVSLFGKLYELRDSTPEEEEGKHFWGELVRDDGERWRVRFKASDAERVAQLFRRQVMVTGRAVYYRAQSPKVIADDIAVDTERDYETAFDELYGCNKEVYHADFNSLLREIRGES